MSRSSISPLLRRWRVPFSFGAALFYFILARPTTRSILVGSALALVGIGWRAWAAGTVRKDSALAIDGPYGFSRNPLYFGSVLIAIGFALASHRVALFCGIFVFFLAIYWPVMREEERHLRELFGDAFEDYARRVPLFLPWKVMSGRGRGEGRFTWNQYWRNREYNAVLGFCGAVALLFLIKYLRGLS